MSRQSEMKEVQGGFFCLGVLVCFIIFLYFAASVSLPTCSVQQFYVAALNKAINTTNPSDIIFFDIKLDNKNQAKGVKYALINLTFYYGSDNSFPVGNYIVPEFYQGIKKDTHRRDVVETHGVPWKAARGFVYNGSTADFRVGMATTVRFKFLGIVNRKHKMDVGAIVAVDDSGEKVSEKGIKFTSGAPAMSRRCGWIGVSVSTLAIVFVFMF